MMYQCVIDKEVRDFDSDSDEADMETVAVKGATNYKDSTWPAQLHLFKDSEWIAKFNITLHSTGLRAKQLKPPYIYKYSVDDGEPTRLETCWEPEDIKYVAEYAAEQYHEHQGGDNDWPVDITLYSEEGDEIGVFEVDREWTPHFTCR